MIRSEPVCVTPAVLEESCRLYLPGREAERGDLSRGQPSDNAHIRLPGLGHMLDRRLYRLLGIRNRHVEVLERRRAASTVGAPFFIG